MTKTKRACDVEVGDVIFGPDGWQRVRSVNRSHGGSVYGFDFEYKNYCWHGLEDFAPVLVKEGGDAGTPNVPPL